MPAPSAHDADPPRCDAVIWTPGAPWPRPAKDRVLVLFARTNDLLDAPPGANDALPEDERTRAAAMRDPGARARFTAGRIALRGLLAEGLGTAPASVHIARGPAGKPRLDPASHAAPWRFNLAHAGDWIAAACAWNREVGVDLEPRRRDRPFLALARRYLGPDAAAALEALPETKRAGLFYDLWTRREALAKALGTGVFKTSIPALLRDAAIPATAPIMLTDDGGAPWWLLDLPAPPEMCAAAAIGSPANAP